MTIETIADLEKHCEENGYHKSNSPDSFRNIPKIGYDTEINFNRENKWVRIVSNLDDWTFAEVCPIPYPSRRKYEVCAEADAPRLVSHHV